LAIAFLEYAEMRSDPLFAIVLSESLSNFLGLPDEEHHLTVVIYIAIECVLSHLKILNLLDSEVIQSYLREGKR
jgi:hypothetical protein